MTIQKLKASEIGKLIGKSRQYVNSYKNRNLLIVGDDGLFDMNNQTNKEWFNRMRDKYISEQSKVNPNETVHVKTKKSESKQETAEKTTEVSAESSDYSIMTLGQAKQQADLELKKLSVQEKRIELDKKQGLLIDVNMALTTIKAYMTIYKRTLHRDLETMVHTICDRNKISLEEKTKYIKNLPVIINSSSDRTMAELEQRLDDEKEQPNG